MNNRSNRATTLKRIYRFLLNHKSIIPELAKTYRIEQVIGKEDNFREHSHDIGESWMRKRSTFLTDFIRNELSRGYTPGQVRNRLKGTGRAGGSERLESVGGAFLDRKDIANIGQEFRTGSLDARKLATRLTLLEDWQQASNFLLEKGYFCKTITAQGKAKDQIRGLVFAYPNRLQTLTNRGFLTIFDSTPKFNVHGYNLFTFMCRDEAAIWVPGANCFVETENSDILAVALQKIYEWSKFPWKVQYPLTDNSAIEKAAVRKAFGKDGHVNEDTNVAYEHMRHAVRVLSEAECMNLCNLAIAAVSTKANKKYIQQEWLERRKSWAMFARQHNQLLLQATSSNACKAWHGRLKLGSGLRKGDSATHGIYGCVRTVHDCAHDMDNNILAAQMNARTRHTTLTKFYPSLKRFPFAVQKIIALEGNKVEIQLEQDMPVPVLEYVNGLYLCNCLVSRRFNFPASIRDSIGYEVLETGILTAQVWRTYEDRLHGGGLEMYEKHWDEEISVSTAIVQLSDNKTLRVLRFGEMNERIRSVFYQLEEQDPEHSSGFVEAINNLITTIISLPSQIQNFVTQPTPTFSTTPIPPLLHKDFNQIQFNTPQASSPLSFEEPVPTSSINTICPLFSVPELPPWVSYNREHQTPDTPPRRRHRTLSIREYTVGNKIYSEWQAELRKVVPQPIGRQALEIPGEKTRLAEK
ncbi:hypothetical protein HOY80DRAFT_1105605 [Tuber brumale]|nr:hypothetical protein HOY80DRAFT_1105605 [Tuber brumale]